VLSIIQIYTTLQSHYKANAWYLKGLQANNIVFPKNLNFFIKCLGEFETTYGRARLKNMIPVMMNFLWQAITVLNRQEQIEVLGIP
jgi:hypothetical protein